MDVFQQPLLDYIWYILPDEHSHHDFNKRLLNTKKPHEPVAMQYSDKIQPKKSQEEKGRTTQHQRRFSP
jgi:hypothetical protein